MGLLTLDSAHLGHRGVLHLVLTGEWLPFSVHDMTWHRAMQYFLESFLGSALLAVAAGTTGFLATWLVASLWRKQ